jgi:hypothetical protein
MGNWSGKLLHFAGVFKTDITLLFDNMGLGSYLSAKSILRTFKNNARHSEHASYTFFQNILGVLAY